MDKYNAVDVLRIAADVHNVQEIEALPTDSAKLKVISELAAGVLIDLDAAPARSGNAYEVVDGAIRETVLALEEYQEQDVEALTVERTAGLLDQLREAIAALEARPPS